MINLYHFTERKNIDDIMKNGILTSSKYEIFSSIRDDVVFCWVSPEDNKMQFEDPVCLKVNVEENLCKIADMEYISLAMMYKYGGGNNKGLNTPVNIEASNLLVKVYEVTAVSLENFKNHFFTPEVLVKGAIKPEHISIFNPML